MVAPAPMRVQATNIMFRQSAIHRFRNPLYRVSNKIFKYIDKLLFLPFCNRGLSRLMRWAAVAWGEGSGSVIPIPPMQSGGQMSRPTVSYLRKRNKHCSFKVVMLINYYLINYTLCSIISRYLSANVLLGCCDALFSIAFLRPTCIMMEQKLISFWGWVAAMKIEYELKLLLEV